MDKSKTRVALIKMKNELITVIFGSLFLYYLFFACTGTLKSINHYRFDKNRQYKLHAFTVTITESDTFKEIVRIIKSKFSDFRASIHLKKGLRDIRPCVLALMAIGENSLPSQPPQTVQASMPACLGPEMT